MTKSAVNKASRTYAGLDVSLKETAICIVDDGGKIVFECMVPTDPQGLPNASANMGLGLSASASRAALRQPGCGASSAG